MTTLLVSQPHGHLHRTPDGHAERPQRLFAVRDALSHPAFDGLARQEAASGDLAMADLVHDDCVLEALQSARPAEGIRQLDPDTFVSEGSLTALAEALGGAIYATERVCAGDHANAFCAIRPPGHHAERKRPMGFCLVNTIAIAARFAQRKLGLGRVAILDFDVHHGNGTQDIFYNDPHVMYASTHQSPLFPGTGAVNETGVGNIVNCPLSGGTAGDDMRDAFTSRIFPALRDFAPDLIFVSAGFDAHHRDPLADLNWTGEDFAWITGKIMDQADRLCAGRIVSLLEGGYDLTGLAEGVTKHVHMLAHGTTFDAEET